MPLGPGVFEKIPDPFDSPSCWTAVYPPFRGCRIRTMQRAFQNMAARVRPAARWCRTVGLAASIGVCAFLITAWVRSEFRMDYMLWEGGADDSPRNVAVASARGVAGARTATGERVDKPATISGSGRGRFLWETYKVHEVAPNAWPAGGSRFQLSLRRTSSRWRNRDYKVW